MEEPSDEENDMLDLAFGLTETYNLINKFAAWMPSIDEKGIRWDGSSNS